jgi:hypothetical protein
MGHNNFYNNRNKRNLVEWIAIIFFLIIALVLNSTYYF